MQTALNRFIEMLKWPAALFMLVTLPALFQSLSWFKFGQPKYLVMFAGFFIYFISRTMADASVKASMQIIAHELTHAFFAVLTLHKVKHIKAEGDDSGGWMSFEGEGNWLIIIAPYFFPLFAFFFMLAVPLFGQYANSLIMNGLMGYFIAYHVDTVASQIHEKQTDLPKVSYKFCFLFLPGANLWMIGMMLAFNSKLWLGVSQYHKLVFWLLEKDSVQVSAFSFPRMPRGTILRSSKCPQGKCFIVGMDKSPQK